MKILDIINSNVYITNLLLIPCIIFSILIHNNISTWTQPLNMNTVDLYSLLWLFITILLIIVVVFSNIFHMYMFTNNKFMKKIGEVDKKYSAPFLGIVVLILNIIYILYRVSPCQKKNSHLKQITIPIFIISFLYSLSGVISFIVNNNMFLLKNILLATNNRYISSHSLNCMRLASHTFFHYMTYSGMILLFLLFYIENKEIYLSLFEKDTCS